MALKSNKYNLENEEINYFKNKAKDPDYCYKWKVENVYLRYFDDGRWQKYGNAEVKAIFCKCGYWSLNYKDFLSN